MNKKIKSISQEIRSGKLMEENIPQLFNHLSNHYKTNAGVRLAMHYYAFYEAYCDDENTWSKESKEAMMQLNQMIKDNILQNQSGVAREKAISCVDAIRNDIIKRMSLLTAYTDIFQTYEYILNRVEYRFKEELEAVDDEELSKEILRYIFDSEDNLVINEKIKEIIGQLPIRITKQKYFDLLKESIHAYLGADQSSLDTYLYMIRTSAMLYQEEGMDTYYPVLWEKKNFLSSLEYKDITQDTYQKALHALQIATLILETETTVYFGLQEIVNELYTILLCAPYAGMVDSDVEEAEEAAFSIIKEINQVFITKEKQELPIDLMEKFTETEGIQEALSYEIETMEDALYVVENDHKAITQSLMLESVLQVLKRSGALLSNSLFIDLEKQTVEEIVDEDRVEKEIRVLEEELTVLFAEHDKVISRAVIANTINKMPVFFHNHKEVMDYIRYSLERCSDSFEKAACVEIINAILSE
jgi:hypothetical protein